MFNQPFFVPAYRMSTMPLNVARAASPTRGLGLFSRLGSAFSGLKNFNWGGLINNASKTLGVINQTIPLVRQVGPMMSNMRSMLKVASIFKDETDKHINNTVANNTNSNIQNTSNNQRNEQDRIESYPNNKEVKDISYNNQPTFFIGS